MDKFTELRAKYDTFVYESFSFDSEGFSFLFRIGEYEFRPVWKWRGLPHTPLTRYIVFSIGMVELVSYWKCACPPRVIVKCGALNEEQIRWWKKLYFGGLGEFFYRNGITADFDSFMNIECDDTDVPRFTDIHSERSGAVIPVGGGKDSIVTLELLSAMRDSSYCFLINPRETTLGCAHTAGYPDERIIAPRRSIDPELLKRNADGWLNGHTPFSAIVAFSAYLAAVVSGARYIALSNESSANEGNVSGSDVNHQYSKSTAFERDFREYCAKWLIAVPEYFSLLRPWTEWRITGEFVKHPKYFPVFKSCNLGSKNDAWCGKCAKCLYVYIMLAGYLDDETLHGIFGKDMLADETLTGMFDALIFPDLDKPFECVGTRDEVNVALAAAVKLREGRKLPALLERYAHSEHAAPADIGGYFDNDNFVPDELLGLLKC